MEMKKWYTQALGCWTLKGVNLCKTLREGLGHGQWFVLAALTTAVVLAARRLLSQPAGAVPSLLCSGAWHHLNETELSGHDHGLAAPGAEAGGRRRILLPVWVLECLSRLVPSPGLCPLARLPAKSRRESHPQPRARRGAQAFCWGQMAGRGGQVLGAGAGDGTSDSPVASSPWAHPSRWQLSCPPRCHMSQPSGSDQSVTARAQQPGAQDGSENEVVMLTNWPPPPTVSVWLRRAVCWP